MPEVNLSLTKWWHYLVATVTVLGPILAFIASAWLWFDTRYMHREISDTRFIELQIKIVQGHIRDFHHITDPSAEDTTNYELDLDQLKNLIQERNRLLGIGDLPQ